MKERVSSEENKEESIQRNVGSKAGEKNPMFGRHHSAETRAKMSVSQSGKKCSPKTRKKMSASQRGKKRSPEVIEKMCERHHSEETKAKIRQSNIGKKRGESTRRASAEAKKKNWQDPEYREMMSKVIFGGPNREGDHPMLGKKHSPESRKNMSDGHAGLHIGEKNPMFGKRLSAESKKKISVANKGRKPSAETIRKFLSRRTPSSLEMKFLGITEKNNLPYKFVGDGSFMIGRKNPDFININGDKIAIEVYARYYKLRHAETVQAWMDDREKVFREYGWSVIFFDETQVTEANVLKELFA